ncbi:hypothetical protein KC19_9G177200 [Ceratodon purpureus]|uniref:Uncharacterized protein n=1 Tax=Ceratodon purpureus TaxID=3225 RepID=A0A8T0GT53_CERPU|nr:hypothetical protein KC19_9G177200 [Ceratodon purpureus]
MDTLWEAFVVVIWSVAVFVGRLVEVVLAWALPRHDEAHEDHTQESTALDRPVYYLDLESQFPSPPSALISPAAATVQSDLDWHVHNFCRLDSRGYRAAVRRHGWRFLPFKQRLEAERHHFNILLAEDLRLFEFRRHTRSWQIPSYVSLDECPPDHTTYPAFYGI